MAKLPRGNKRVAQGCGPCGPEWVQEASSAVFPHPLWLTQPTRRQATIHEPHAGMRAKSSPDWNGKRAIMAGTMMASPAQKAKERKKDR